MFTRRMKKKECVSHSLCVCVLSVRQTYIRLSTVWYRGLNYTGRKPYDKLMQTKVSLSTNTKPNILLAQSGVLTDHPSPIVTFLWHNSSYGHFSEESWEFYSKFFSTEDGFRGSSILLTNWRHFLYRQQVLLPFDVLFPSLEFLRTRCNFHQLQVSSDKTWLEDPRSNLQILKHNSNDSVHSRPLVFIQKLGMQYNERWEHIQ